MHILSEVQNGDQSAISNFVDARNAVEELYNKAKAIESNCECALKKMFIHMLH